LKGKKCWGWYWSEIVVEVYVYRLLPNDEALFALAERLEETLLLGEDLAFEGEGKEREGEGGMQGGKE
jgi:hypothetical protein